MVSKMDIPFPLQGIMRGPVSESDYSSLLIYYCFVKHPTVLTKLFAPDQDQQNISSDLNINRLKQFDGVSKRIFL